MTNILNYDYSKRDYLEFNITVLFDASHGNQISLGLNHNTTGNWNVWQNLQRETIIMSFAEFSWTMQADKSVHK